MTAPQLEAWLRNRARRPLVMAVLNVTPDSFSDGNRFLDPSAGIAHALEMTAAGADLLDIGGESTRPGSSPVSAAEQLRRVIPVIESIRRQSPIAISVDTTQSAVAAAALDAGADIINDTSAGRDDPQMLPLAAQRQAPIILMHMQGTPATMQLAPHYSDVVAEVAAFLEDRRRAATAIGVDPVNVLLDPGIGFGKTVEHNLQLLRALPTLVDLGAPVVVGTSRKAFLRKLWTDPGSDNPSAAADANSIGTAATLAWAVASGAAVVRVHDPGSARGVVRIVESIRMGHPAPEQFPVQ